MTTNYYARTDDDDAVLWLVRVTDADVALWNATRGAWVPAPDPSATLALVEPGADPDYTAVPAADVPGIIAQL